MKFNFLQLVTLLFIYGTGTSCNSNPHAKESPSQKNNNIVTKQSTEIIDTIRVASSKQITGIWATTDKEILTVDISKDSIFYTEHFESYKYEIKKDSIYIHYPDFIFSGRPYLINDSLVISSIDGDVKYVRVKN